MKHWLTEDLVLDAMKMALPCPSYVLPKGIRKVIFGSWNSYNYFNDKASGPLSVLGAKKSAWLRSWSTVQVESQHGLVALNCILEDLA